MPRRPKYEPLREYLEAATVGGRRAVDLEFSDVAAMVGGLPDTAYGHRQWWANDSKVQAQAWRAAGWHVETVSLDHQRVRFPPGRVGDSYAARKARERVGLPSAQQRDPTRRRLRKDDVSQQALARQSAGD